MKYLITGITGTLGQAVTKLCLDDPNAEVIGVSRDEQKQRLIAPHRRLKLHLGDVRDRERMLELCQGVDVIFHFAALKCVDSIEADPYEAFKTNVIGTENLLFAQSMWRIPRIVLASTDKAAYPVNAYGASKAMAERLVLARPNNAVCRYGNVIASRGSVVPVFVKTLKDERSVSITDERMTRFLIRIEDAARFVYAAAHGTDGGLRTPDMKAAPMTLVAEAVAGLLGVDQYESKIVGIRPGEKIHECLRMSHEGKESHSNTCAQFTKEELSELLAPIVRAFA